MNYIATRNILRYNKIMQITNLHTDQAVLKELGRRLAKHRLMRNKTQAEFAEECGLGRRTIQYAESGRSVQAESLIRILRSLNLLDALEALLPDPGVQPMDMLKLKKKERKRVAKKRSDQQPQSAEEWQWGDDE